MQKRGVAKLLSVKDRSAGITDRWLFRMKASVTTWAGTNLDEFATLTLQGSRRPSVEGHSITDVLMVSLQQSRSNGWTICKRHQPPGIQRVERTMRRVGTKNSKCSLYSSYVYLTSS
jgi:hypothetical protein